MNRNIVSTSGVNYSVYKFLKQSEVVFLISNLKAPNNGHVNIAMREIDMAKGYSN